MQWSRINRSSPEKIFITVYNSYSTASLTNGQVVIWDYATDANGISVTKPTASDETGGRHYGGAFAGIAAETIAAGAYGLVQVYGYHSAVRVRNVTGGAPALAAGGALTTRSAVFCLENFSAEMVTSTTTQGQFQICAIALAAQASWTTKAIACFIKFA